MASTPVSSREKPFVGWNKSKFLRFGLAKWEFTRKGFEAVPAVYRNLVNKIDWKIGDMASGSTDTEIINLVGSFPDSYTAGDVIVVNGRIIGVIATDKPVPA